MLSPRLQNETSTPVATNVDAQAWRRVRDRLRARLGETVFSSWFASLEWERIEGQRVILSAPTRFLKSWIQGRYLDPLTAALRAEMGEIAEVTIELRGAERPARPLPARPLPARPAAVAAPAPLAVAAASPQFEGSSLDKRLNFGRFVVGAPNQLAHAAAIQASLSGAGAPASFNPLYLHSAVGLGKTHLLQALVQAATESGRRALYVTAETFIYGFVCALKAQNALAFKERLRSVDLLAIDDLQFLQGQVVQNEFQHTINALIDSRRQVIMAGDRPPCALENLDERMRSRVGGGLSVEIQAFDDGLRQKILEDRIAAAQRLQPDFRVADGVVAMVAATIRSNGRDLEGAVNRLLAHSLLTGKVLTLEKAHAAIGDLARGAEPRRVLIEDIQKAVATHFHVSKADMLSARRTANVVWPRQIAIYLSKTMTPRSLPEIGRRFGGRDHTTVLHAVRKIDACLIKDAALSREIEALRRELAG
jgi:chromosomal replication initiator protein